MVLTYSAVARGQVVLAECTITPGNFSAVAAQCLQKIGDKDAKFTISADKHTFNFLVADGFTYVVVADEDYGRQIPFGCLDRIKEEFASKFADKGHAATAGQLTVAFGPRLKEHMKHCMENPEEINKVAKVQKQVAEVKNVMLENIEKVLDRGEKIEDLFDKTDVLRSQADTFHRQGRALRTKMWWNNFKMQLIVVAVLCGVGLVLFLIICFGVINNCTKKK